MTCKSYQQSYPNLEQALRDGANIHAFRSGGGLRVVRLEKEGKLISYGEHPYFSTALSHAESDFGLSYDEQYSGKKSKHRHYLTGACMSSPWDAIDTYVNNGYALDVFWSKKWNRFVCTSYLYKSQEIKDHLKDPDKLDCRYGSTNNIIGAITDCLLSMQLANMEELMKRC